ncbi:MAG: hypothetical protein AAGB00_03385 [Planctomycetota bacterium]
MDELPLAGKPKNAEDAVPFSKYPVQQVMEAATRLLRCLLLTAQGSCRSGMTKDR